MLLLLLFGMPAFGFPEEALLLLRHKQWSLFLELVARLRSERHQFLLVEPHRCRRRMTDSTPSPGITARLSHATPFVDLWPSGTGTATE
uniref:Putative secreted protein n=1 Tax=Anopheles triannulatus TaxID=58253 RepID=A0A2M4B1W6_9DIPT